MANFLEVQQVILERSFPSDRLLVSREVNSLAEQAPRFSEREERLLLKIVSVSLNVLLLFYDEIIDDAKSSAFFNVKLLSLRSATRIPSLIRMPFIN